MPLAGDVKRWQKSLRLPVTTEIKVYDLDLRKENDLARSLLFHRLELAGHRLGRRAGCELEGVDVSRSVERAVAARVRSLDYRGEHLGQHGRSGGHGQGHP